MTDTRKFFIDGAWVDPVSPAEIEVIDPATETAYAVISAGTAADVERAVAAARAAFPAWSATPPAERIALLKRVLEAYKARYEDMAQAISHEMGAPITWAREAQAYAGQGHLEATIAAAERFAWEESRGTTQILREGVGVCALITPWNWPMNQIVCKVAPAIVAGCTVVLKPSEIAPMSGLLFAEIMAAAGTPKGVFNLVNGTGPDVGQVMAAHPEVDMVSFTGSTRAGIIVARTAAETVKRVAQELGGKSPNLVLPDADLEKAVREGTIGVMNNTGQSCDAPTRMLVPRARHAEALAIAKAAAESVVIGDPRDEATTMGPLVSALQFDKVQRLIEAGIAEGATLVTGGPGKPAGRNTGYFVRPTVFGGVTNDMTIAREEIFGPVLSILPYDTVEEAIAIANDTVYGLAAYIQSGSLETARTVARQLRAGSVYVNGPAWDLFAPFGGYKQSGNGREYADWGIHDFTEVKGVCGWS
ncbi:aldehyde dehydrogenase family protein [Sinirhodobacter huangdaonensis]|uniref:Aldehyde dehydrogenase family protein n=1 Tax=Paenirhodobacter huangdaonensis TaxID=2501515 RepID=A0A3S3LXN0_9RHOB|nr:aldehyde dehydrogenase family protein [Sinirhodobacter huangdaonensis]RWR50024.1 aldehyde dehydrogenase family protein [Sinirhodobacter huangdaonensis]